MLSAFYDVATGRAPDMLRAFLLAVLLQMVTVNTMVEYGYLQATVPLFFGLVTMVAGVVYGLGMVLAMGCAGAVFYRLGEGKLDYAFAIAAFSAGAWAANEWLVTPLRGWLGNQGAPLTLHTALTVDRWLLMAIIGLAVVLWVIRGKRRAYAGGWDWTRTGIFIGITGVTAWATSALTGHPSGLGTVVGSDSLATLILERDPSALTWNLFLVVGIPLGSLVSTRFHGRSPGRPLRLKRIPQAVAGGLLMGAGAAVAAGDNVYHGLSGVPLLAVGSITFMVCAFLGVWLGVRLHWLR
jgi:uncharacterized membrane protein YedE/YeeE